MSIELGGPQPQAPSSPWTDSRVLSGFPQTAHFLAADPEKSTVIFRRFDKVSVRNLLYLEGRIAALENVQEKLDKEDKKLYHEDRTLAEAARSWEDFALLGRDHSERKWSGSRIPPEVYMMWQKTKEKRYAMLRQIRAEQSGRLGFTTTDSNEYPADESNLVQLRWDVASLIKEAVKEYQEAVILYSRMLSLEAPAERSRETVADWFKGVYTDPKTKQKESSSTPQFFEDSAMSRIFESGAGSGIHSAKGPNDLVSLHSPADDDLLSKEIAKSLWTSRLFKDKGMSDSEIAYVPEKKIHEWVTLIGLVAAVFFLIAAVWTLWVIPARLYVVKLGVLTAFVILFGVWVNYATTATRSEVFAATAAYAAVLVVYVGK